MLRGRGRRVVWLVAGMTASLMGLGLTPAGGKDKLDSFGGSCVLQGMVTFSPPVTNTQQSLTVRYDGPGTCSGTLNGRQVTNVPVRVREVVEAVDGSCLRASTTVPGQGELRFPDGTTIAFTWEFDFVLSDGTITYRGQRSGSAIGHGSFVTDRTPPDVSEQCAGEGARELPLDVQLATESPLVSR
jgi:hypothetical protein